MDSLSPFLFLLVAECLAWMTNENIANNLIKGSGPSDESRTILVQFADDTLFFYEARKRYMRNLKFLRHLFEWDSGTKVNKKKSKLYYMGQIEEKATRLANLPACKVGSLSTNYTLAYPSLSDPILRRIGQELSTKSKVKAMAGKPNSYERG